MTSRAQSAGRARLGPRTLSARKRRADNRRPFIIQAALGKTCDDTQFSPRYLVRAGFAYREDQRLKLALSVNSVASQYWGDANAAFSTPDKDNYIPAKVPQYTIADFSGDYWLLPHLRLLGGVSNLGDKKYYNRVFSNGIEPGLRRTYYAGFAYEF